MYGSGNFLKKYQNQQGVVGGYMGMVQPPMNQKRTFEEEEEEKTWEGAAMSSFIGSLQGAGTGASIGGSVGGGYGALVGAIAGTIAGGVQGIGTYYAS